MKIFKIIHNGQFATILQYGFNSVISRLITFIVIIFVTKTFILESVSDFFLFLNLNSIIVSISLLGIPMLIIKQLSGFYNQSYNFFELKKFIIFCICISMFFFIIMITIFSFYYSNLNYFLYICIASFFTIANILCSNILICCNKIIFSQFFDNVLKYLIILLLIFFNNFFNNENIISVMIFYIISNILILIILISKIFLLLKSKKENINYEIDNNYKQYLKFIFFTGIATLSTILNSKIDLLIIDQLLDKRFVALYGVGIQISFIIFLFTTICYHVFSPKISVMVKKNKIKLLNLILDSYRFILFFFCGFLYLILFFFVDYIVIIFFSPQYLEVANVIKIISLGYFVMVPFYFSDLILNLQNNEEKVALTVVFSAFINIAFNLILIPKIGMDGAAYALLLSHIVQFSLYNFFQYRNLYIFKNIFFLIKYKKYRLIKKILYI